MWESAIYWEYPTLTARHITPLLFYNWGIACCCFTKHSEKKPTEIISFVADSMLEPHLVAWYNSDTKHIDGLTLEAYLLKLSKLVLKKNWAIILHNEILSSHQGSKYFMNWKIELENLNAVLITTSPAHTLD
ncbi:hypothetical protein BDQ17DRAFT_1426578 [Cyathus striatus]|nr:hypothetical protein BDQ17DRAFT_1440560 [Cyathus striatus]KAF9001287.1 hypothetical protein BDQ17DRAFT_1426578 [Cyathus striatus]